MSDPTGEMDPYQIVLRDLRAQRSRIDDAIAAIERVLGISSPATAQHSASSGDQSSAFHTLGSGPQPTQNPSYKKEPISYAGLTIYEAAKRELDRAQNELTNAEIAHGIVRGGLTLNSADPLNTVASVLTRRFYDHGDIVRVGRGTWGLPEWYSDHDYRAEALKNRAKRHASSPEAASAKASTSASERPSEPQRSAPQDLDVFFGLSRQPNRA